MAVLRGTIKRISNIPEAVPLQYDPLNEQARLAGVLTGMSENHGILCGLLCGRAGNPEQVWLAELLGDCNPADPQVAVFARELSSIFATTQAAMTGPELRLGLILPDDDQSLGIRALALRDWCRGFLYGLGLAGQPGEGLNGDAMEAVGDLAAIAAMIPAGEVESESNEEALMELSEFVWVAAMLIFEEGRGP